MGTQLSKPVTEKMSSDQSNDKLICGTSSMQGWRISQEDAHNCLLDYDTNSSFFAVYDGHGGHEVAAYCSEYLPDFLKQTEAYKAGDFKKALEDAFVEFDATIVTPEVITKLKKIMDDKPKHKRNDSDSEEEEEDEENVKDLFVEAAMPIEQVIEKYAAKSLYQSDEAVKNFISSFRNANQCASGSSRNKGDAALEGTSDVTSSSNIENKETSTTSDKCGDSTNDINILSTKSDVPNEACTESVIPDIKVDSPDSSVDKSETCMPSIKISDSVNSTATNQNGEAEPLQTNELSKCEVVTSSTLQENGEAIKKGKGKALTKTKGVDPPNVNTRPKRSAQQLYNKLLDFEEDSEEELEDEDDKDFEGSIDESSDDECVNTSIDDDDDDDNSDDSSEDEADEDEEEEEKDEADDDMCGQNFLSNMLEEPGTNSGCTAVVALIRENTLYVANAGDSRCVVCRNGKAVAMSFDHKPSNTKERNRIIKAGGSIIDDDRVNGGLNLSRAIGDHGYKQNKNLPAHKQMIIALPDIKSITLNPNEDEFMFLACDGIWNCMSNQKVINFIRAAIQEGTKTLSQICEDLFELCLKNRLDGIDNMTAIIVQFKSHILKRSSDVSEESDANKKKLKIQESVESNTEYSVHT